MDRSRPYPFDRSGDWKRLAIACGVGLVFSVPLSYVQNSQLEFVVIAMLLVVAIALLARLIGNQVQEGPSILHTAVMLARDPDVFERYQHISLSLQQISWRNDPIYRDVAIERLEKLASEIRQVSEGVVLFEGTETWRLAYERLLRSRGLYLYRSVSWVTTEKYWQDEPGRHSMRLNLQLHDSEGLKIERIVIIADELWPTDEQMPSSRICQWIHEQHTHGIWIKLVRQSQLSGESDLLADIGIYGSRAVGTQTVDDQGRTIKFKLDFDIARIEEAEQGWKRLDVYAAAYGDLLDHFTIDD